MNESTCPSHTKHPMAGSILQNAIYDDWLVQLQAPFHQYILICGHYKYNNAS